MNINNEYVDFTKLNYEEFVSYMDILAKEVAGLSNTKREVCNENN
jgi:hypothetical protein